LGQQGRKAFRVYREFKVFREIVVLRELPAQRDQRVAHLDHKVRKDSLVLPARLVPKVL
jgi:hypothetical protein